MIRVKNLVSARVRVRVSADWVIQADEVEVAPADWIVELVEMQPVEEP